MIVRKETYTLMSESFAGGKLLQFHVFFRKLRSVVPANYFEDSRQN